MILTGEEVISPKSVILTCRSDNFLLLHLFIIRLCLVYLLFSLILSLLLVNKDLYNGNAARFVYIACHSS